MFLVRKGPSRLGAPGLGAAPKATSSFCRATSYQGPTPTPASAGKGLLGQADFES